MGTQALLCGLMWWVGSKGMQRMAHIDANGPKAALVLQMTTYGTATIVCPAVYDASWGWNLP
eukprot:158215-Pleurochrysis_carterae.AAC.2